MSGDHGVPFPACSVAVDGTGRALRLTGLVAIAFQFVGLVFFSAAEYSRFALTQDFAAYTQVWWKIGHLHLNPSSTVLSTTFWRNDGEFLMWPIALASRVYPHPIALLWLQDAAVAGTELVTFLWVLDILRNAKEGMTDRFCRALALAALVALVVNPWAFATIATDFHFEPFFAFFGILIARDLWNGRTRRLWWWVPPLLLSQVPGGLCLLGIGISGILAGRSTRRPGVALGLVGLAWVGTMSAIGAAGLSGEVFASGYGYLVGPHTKSVTLLAVLRGVVSHPTAVARMIGHRLPWILALVAPAGFVGIFSSWGFGMALVTLLPSVLDTNLSYLSEPFQSWPMLPFVLVGSVLLLSRILARRRPETQRIRVGLALTLAGLVVVCASRTSSVIRDNLPIGTRTSAVLADLLRRVDPHAQVVASNGVVGRFGERNWVYPFPFEHHASGGSEWRFPVKSSEVIFLFSYQGMDRIPSRDTSAGISFVEHRLGARPLSSSAGVHALVWTPPAGLGAISIDVRR